jgi:hypothetical protein
MKRWRWVVPVVFLLPLAVISVLLLSAKESDRNQMSHEAIAHCRATLLACEAYYQHPGSGKKYPSSLTDLVEPPFGGPSFLRTGQTDLIDPWRNPYRYAVVKTASGDTELYVWAERVVNGKLKLLGAKMRPGGQTEVFGLPEE